MTRLAALTLAAAALAASVTLGTVSGAPSGDQTIRGNLYVNGSLQVQGVGISNVSSSLDVGNTLTTSRVQVANGGAGIAWATEADPMATRIIAGEFTDPTSVQAPPSTLLIRRNPAQVWFNADGGWTCLAGC